MYALMLILGKVKWRRKCYSVSTGPMTVSGTRFNFYATLCSGSQLHLLKRKLKPAPLKYLCKFRQPPAAKSGQEPSSKGRLRGAGIALPFCPQSPWTAGARASRPPYPRSPSRSWGPAPTCGHTTTRGDAAPAYKAATPSAGGSGRPPAPKKPYLLAHLQRPQELPGTGSLRLGAGLIPEGERTRGHVRFRRGGTFGVAMSRYKFIGKKSISGP